MTFVVSCCQRKHSSPQPFQNVQLFIRQVGEEHALAYQYWNSIFKGPGFVLAHQSSRNDGSFQERLIYPTDFAASPRMMHVVPFL